VRQYDPNIFKFNDDEDDEPGSALLNDYEERKRNSSLDRKISL